MHIRNQRSRGRSGVVPVETSFHTPATREPGKVSHQFRAQRRWRYLQSDGDGWAAFPKHWVISSHEPDVLASKGIAERNATFPGSLKVEHDGCLQFNLFHIAASIALRVGLIHLLRDRDATGSRVPPSEVPDGNLDVVGAYRTRTEVLQGA